MKCQGPCVIKHMVKRLVLISAIIITLIFTLMMMTLVCNKLGFERLPPQSVKSGFELLMIFLILNP